MVLNLIDKYVHEPRCRYYSRISDSAFDDALQSGQGNVLKQFTSHQHTGPTEKRYVHETTDHLRTKPTVRGSYLIIISGDTSTCFGYLSRSTSNHAKKLLE